MKQFLALSLLAGVLACGGGADSGSTGPNGPALALLADTVRVGTVVQVRLVGVRTTHDSLAATLGGASILLGRVNDSTLVTIVPERPAGAASLAVTIDGATLSTRVSVLPALAIANPVATITTSLDAPRLSLSATPPSGVDSADWAAMRTSLDSMVADAKAQVAALPAADQLALARMLASGSIQQMAQANLVAIDGAAATWGDQSCDLAMSNFSLSVAGAVFFGNIFAGTINFPPLNPLAKVAGVAAAGAAFGGAMMNLYAKMGTLRAQCMAWDNVEVYTTFPLAALHATGSPTASATALARLSIDVPATVRVVGGFRPLSAADVAADATLSAISATLDRLYGVVNSVLSSLPGFLRSRIPAMPKPLSQLPAGAVTTRSVTGGEVRVENVTPSAISITTTASGSSLVLTPHGNITDSTTTSFDVVSIAAPSVRKRVTVVVEPRFIGTWDAYQGRYQPGEPTYAVPGTYYEDNSYRIELLDRVYTFNRDGTFSRSGTDRWTTKSDGSVQLKSAAGAGTWTPDGRTIHLSGVNGTGNSWTETGTVTADGTLDIVYDDGFELWVRHR